VISILLKAGRWLAFSIVIGGALACCQGKNRSFVSAPASESSGRAIKGAAPSLEKSPDGNWLRDDEGREYSLQRIPKNEAHRIDNKTVRSRWGLPLAVVKEDDKFYYYKVYKPLVPPHPAAQD
jgi:hypothetical protein